MRYLFGFVCVCALGVVPLVGCSETTGDGGSGGMGGDGGSAGSGGTGGTGGSGGTAGGPVDQVTCSDALPCTVWLLGDSNTAAMGDNFVSIDGNHPEYDTVNLGRGGASSADGLADVESLLAVEEAPEIAVVTYAGGDFLESYPAAPPGATSPTRAEVDRIYGNLEAICELLQSEGTYCVLGKSIGALTELHPLDEGLPPGAIDFAALTYFDNGYVLVGEAIEERYQPGWVSFRVPKDFDLWGHGDLFGYIHLTQAGYSIMSDRLEAKLDDLIRDAMLCESASDCDDGNECTADACNPAHGLCDDTPVQDGSPCAGGTGMCRGGVCHEPDIAFTGAQEDVIGVGQWGLWCVPDEHISYYKTDSAFHIWFTQGEAHHFTSSDFNELTPTTLLDGNSVPAFGPSGEGFDRDYAGPGSVIRASNGQDLLMLYHGEYQWPQGGYYATIGLARSSDEGQTWERLGPVIEGRLPRPDPPPWYGAFGAGGPCALVNESDGFIYLYYLDWGAPLFHPSDIHLARAAIASDGMPGSWRKYFQGEFGEDGLGGNSEPVIRGPSSTGFWAGFPSVSYNVSLDAYLAVFVSADGFYYSASSDLTNWTVGKKLLTRNETPNTGEPWLLYPSLLSPSQPTDSTTGATGYLYYGHGIYNVECHHMVRRSVRILWDKSPLVEVQPLGPSGSAESRIARY